MRLENHCHAYDSLHTIRMMKTMVKTLMMTMTTKDNSDDEGEHPGTIIRNMPLIHGTAQAQAEYA